MLVELFFVTFFFDAVGGVVVAAANSNAPANRAVRISIHTLFFNRFSEGQVGDLPHKALFYCVLGVVPAKNELTHLGEGVPAWRVAPTAACMIWKTTGSPGFSELQMRVTSSAFVTG